MSSLKWEPTCPTFITSFARACTQHVVMGSDPSMVGKVGWVSKMMASRWGIRTKRVLPSDLETVIERGGKEGHALLNDALNTFYLRLYGVGHIVKDHSDSERGNQLS